MWKPSLLIAYALICLAVCHGKDFFVSLGGSESSDGLVAVLQTLFNIPKYRWQLLLNPDHSKSVPKELRKSELRLYRLFNKMDRAKTGEHVALSPKIEAITSSKDAVSILKSILALNPERNATAIGFKMNSEHFVNGDKVDQATEVAWPDVEPFILTHVINEDVGEAQSRELFMRKDEQLYSDGRIFRKESIIASWTGAPEEFFIHLSRPSDSSSHSVAYPETILLPVKPGTPPELSQPPHHLHAVIFKDATGAAGQPPKYAAIVCINIKSQKWIRFGNGTARDSSLQEALAQKTTAELLFYRWEENRQFYLMHMPGERKTWTWPSSIMSGVLIALLAWFAYRRYRNYRKSRQTAASSVLPI